MAHHCQKIMNYNESSDFDEEACNVFTINSELILNPFQNKCEKVSVDYNSNNDDYKIFLQKTGRIWPNYNEINQWGVNNLYMTPSTGLSVPVLQDIANRSFYVENVNFNGSKVASVEGSRHIYQVHFRTNYFPIELSYFKVNPELYKQVICQLNKLSKLQFYTIIHNKFLRIISLIIFWSLLIAMGIIFCWKVEGQLNADVIITVILLAGCFVPIFLIYGWMIISKKINHDTYRVLTKINEEFTKSNILCGIEDPETCSKNEMKLHFIYFRIQDCKNELSFQLQFTNLIKRNFSKTCKIMNYSPNMTSIGPNKDFVVQGNSTVSYENSQILSKMLLLYHSAKYVSMFIKNELPIPNIQLHSQINVPCLCQFVSMMHFNFETGYLLD